MLDKPHTFDAKLEHIRLQKHVYDLVRVQNLSVKDVMQKTGLSKVTIYRYLRTFVDDKIYNFITYWYIIFYDYFQKVILEFSTILAPLFSLY